MNLAEYMPQALAALDAESESRLAVALDNLKRADDKYMIGLGLIKCYVRGANPLGVPVALVFVVTCLRRRSPPQTQEERPFLERGCLAAFHTW